MREKKKNRYKSFILVAQSSQRLDHVHNRSAKAPIQRRSAMRAILSGRSYTSCSLPSLFCLFIVAPNNIF
ncbi:hypothetical protein M441DRAFT_411271 [Trichoderma asperellum CBS 433.97]|uniref:Uncharacterized protein n=1 Tax=Trichoderma asperellum (strain ATCC 204424 / CBS 433.97 / NBRC 101777) TaxID=1042311 RepID=A0A2T3Z7F1_TRIA4|nr:hypothetical protein M441DRAFT_411271 [Trichoderma asperellum CBS 433.97]PTB40739.1 hypothetical protein M441DRAFT_411271 [Trichoderma asperellum CBS 433.97]